MRVYRIIAIAVVAAACFTSVAASRTVPIRTLQSDEQQLHLQQQQLRKAARTVANFRTTTFLCQDKLGVPRTRASVSAWGLPASIPYRTWVASLWKKRAAACGERLAARTIPITNDWQTAVRLVQRIYPGTSSWLLYISHREGGHGGFVMNHQGSGAGGWMQFMASTYYAYNDDAFADAKRRGFIVNESLNRWESAFGQALTAGYMKYTGREGCHWCL